MTDTPKDDGSKIREEKETVEKMISYYCEKKHTPSEGICEDCTQLLIYSHQRLDLCKFGEDKPTCRKCAVHCYKPNMRKQIRSVMRYSGPRLLFRAPVVWIKHRIQDRV